MGFFLEKFEKLIPSDKILNTLNVVFLAALEDKGMQMP